MPLRDHIPLLLRFCVFWFRYTIIKFNSNLCIPVNTIYFIQQIIWNFIIHNFTQLVSVHVILWIFVTYK